MEDVLFIRKTQKQNHLPFFSNQSSAIQTTSQKPLVLVLESQLDFNEYLQNTLNKVSIVTSFFSELQDVLLRSSLLTIFKAFILPLIDYVDVIYNQSYNVSFNQKLEMFQCNAVLVITGAIHPEKNFTKS